MLLARYMDPTARSVWVKPKVHMRVTCIRGYGCKRPPAALAGCSHAQDLSGHQVDMAQREQKSLSSATNLEWCIQITNVRLSDTAAGASTARGGQST